MNVETPMTRLRSYDGPALFSYGFRPFFLAGTSYGAIAILLWLPIFLGKLTLPTAFPPLAWHAHEMLYGFLPAIVTGFLLTAVPNWTGQLPLRGTPLVLLAAVWLAGRLAIAFSSVIGAVPAALVDCSFLALVSLAMGREIVTGGNWRNLKVIALVVLLLAGNLLFHIELPVWGSVVLAERVGIAAIIMLIVLIGGRIVPSFTRNWLAQHNPGRLPVAFNRTDIAIVALTAIALASWAGFGAVLPAGVLFAAVSVAQTWRLARWAGWRTARDPLVLILHLAYAFIPLGFAAMAAAIFLADTSAQNAAMHIWTVGAVGGMTLAVMTRASLGHTGRPLRAGRATVVLYAAVILAALARAAAALLPEVPVIWLHLAAFFWLVAFGGFALIYGPMLLLPRR